MTPPPPRNPDYLSGLKGKPKHGDQKTVLLHTKLISHIDDRISDLKIDNNLNLSFSDYIRSLISLDIDSRFHSHFRAFYNNDIPNRLLFRPNSRSRKAIKGVRFPPSFHLTLVEYLKAIPKNKQSVRSFNNHIRELAILDIVHDLLSLLFSQNTNYQKLFPLAY